MRSSWVKRLVLLGACGAVGCGGSNAGDSCGPGTVLVGSVCTVAAEDAASDQATAQGDSTLDEPDVSAPDAGPPDVTALVDSAQEAGATEAAPTDAAAPDPDASDAPSAAQTPDAQPSDAPPANADAGLTDAGNPDGASAGLDATLDSASVDASHLDAASADAGAAVDSGSSDGAAVDAPPEGGRAEGGDAGDGGSFFGAPSCPGDAGTPPTTFLPLEGGLREILIDPCNTHVYVTNQSANQIEDYSVAAGGLAAPIAVGSSPSGFDVTPDGTRLYVANTGGANVSVVDLASRHELKKISFTSNTSGDTAFSLAIAANGTALFSTTFGGSGFGGRMMALDMSTEVISQRTDFFFSGETTEATVVKSASSHAVIGAAAGDISSGPVFIYQSATDKFSSEHDLNGFYSRVAVSGDGSTVLVDGSLVLDSSSNLLGTISGAATPYAAFGPSASVAYRADASSIDILDAVHFLATGSINVTADTMTNTYGASAVGNMAVSSDGKWIAMITDHGLTIVDVP